MHRRKKTLFLTLTLILSAIIPFIATEIFLQIADRPTSEIKIGWYYKGKHQNQINELGYRGKPILYDEKDTVILLIGDSQVEAEGMNFGNMPENLLQKLFKKNTKVFSIGASGYGNDQQLLALNNYFKKYRANKVILWQTFDNDLWNNTFPTHAPKNGAPKPTFVLKNDSLIYPNDTIGAVKKRSKIKLKILVDRLFASGLDEEHESILPNAYKPSYGYKGKYSNLLDDEYGGNPNENYQTEKNHYATRFFPISYRTKYSVKLTNLLLKKIESVCEENNANFLLFNVDLKDFNPKHVPDTTI